MKERNSFVDKLKGFTILLVIYGHCISRSGFVHTAYDNEMICYIYSFHMPLFMFLSGYVLAYSINKPWQKLLVSRVKNYLIPCMTYGVLNLICYSLREDGGVQGITVSRIFFCFVNDGLWFLYDVLFNTIIVVIVYKAIREYKLQVIIITAFMLFLLIVEGRVPLLRAGITMFPYFCVGFYYHLFSSNDNVLRMRSLLIKISLLGYPYLLLLYFTRYKQERLFLWVIGFSGTIFIIAMFNYLRLNEKAESVLIGLGRISLEIYYTQMLVTAYFVPFVVKLMCNSKLFARLSSIYSIVNFVLIPISALLSTVFIMCIIKVIKRSLMLSRIIWGR